jgi:hypothetical protein
MAIQASRPADDVVARTEPLPIPGLGLLPVNAYPVRASSRCSATAACPPPGWISCKPSSQIGSAHVRWINLMHPDRDHRGSLMQILGAAPNGHLITTFLGQGMINVLLQWRKHDDIDDWWL